MQWGAEKLSSSKEANEWVDESKTGEKFDHSFATSIMCLWATSRYWLRTVYPVFHWPQHNHIIVQSLLLISPTPIPLVHSSSPSLLTTCSNFSYNVLVPSWSQNPHSSAYLVLGIEVGTLLLQHLHHIKVPPTAGPMQGCGVQLSASSTYPSMDENHSVLHPFSPPLIFRISFLHLSASQKLTQRSNPILCLEFPVNTFRELQRGRHRYGHCRNDRYKIAVLLFILSFICPCKWL